MTQVAYAGEFSDGTTYTHTRIAGILGVEVRWVLDNMIRAHNGARYHKVGAVYFLSGADIRNWIERCGQFYGEIQPAESSPRSASGLAS